MSLAITIQLSNVDAFNKFLWEEAEYWETARDKFVSYIRPEGEKILKASIPDRWARIRGSVMSHYYTERFGRAIHWEITQRTLDNERVDLKINRFSATGFSVEAMPFGSEERADRNSVLTARTPPAVSYFEKALTGETKSTSIDLEMLLRVPEGSLGWDNRRIDSWVSEQQDWMSQRFEYSEFFQRVPSRRVPLRFGERQQTENTFPIYEFAARQIEAKALAKLQEIFLHRIRMEPGVEGEGWARTVIQGFGETRIHEYQEQRKKEEEGMSTFLREQLAERKRMAKAELWQAVYYPEGVLAPDGKRFMIPTIKLTEPERRELFRMFEREKAQEIARRERAAERRAYKETRSTYDRMKKLEEKIAREDKKARKEEERKATLGADLYMSMLPLEVQLALRMKDILKITHPAVLEDQLRDFERKIKQYRRGPTPMTGTWIFGDVTPGAAGDPIELTPYWKDAVENWDKKMLTYEEAKYVARMYTDPREEYRMAIEHPQRMRSLKYYAQQEIKIRKDMEERRIKRFYSPRVPRNLKRVVTKEEKESLELADRIERNKKELIDAITDPNNWINCNTRIRTVKDDSLASVLEALNMTGTAYAGYRLEREDERQAIRSKQKLMESSGKRLYNMEGKSYFLTPVERGTIGHAQLGLREYVKKRKGK